MPTTLSGLNILLPGAERPRAAGVLRRIGYGEEPAERQTETSDVSGVAVWAMVMRRALAAHAASGWARG